MPIKIHIDIEGNETTAEKTKTVAWLCDDDWELPVQLFEFERWLKEKGKDLPKGKYIADIGFRPRPDAFGGGGTLSVSSMQILVMVGIEVWFSEYPS